MSNVERMPEASERELRAVLDHLPVGIVVRRGGLIAYANLAVATSFGIDVAALVGRRIVELARPEFREGLASCMDASDRGEKLPAYEFGFDRADGRIGTIEVSAAHKLRFGGVPSVLVTWRDVSEERAMRDRLLMADRMAAVGTLASGLAHEINNPLACVTANLELLREELAPPADSSPSPPRVPPPKMTADEMIAALDDAREGAERVRLIVRDLRLFTRGDACERGPVELAGVLQSSERMAGPMIKSRARVVRDLPALPLVDANATRLCQV
ncbi:MAG: PAS domain S-box protein, partial [Myxococcales bacterium]|nr:PAS domain S-box protein [Myxococcales bacterium]